MPTVRQRREGFVLSKNDAVKYWALRTSTLGHATYQGLGLDMTVQIEAGRSAKVPEDFKSEREISGDGGGAGARSENADESGGGRAAAARCGESLRSKGNGHRWRPGP